MPHNCFRLRSSVSSGASSVRRGETTKTSRQLLVLRRRFFRGCPTVDRYRLDLSFPQIASVFTRLQHDCRDLLALMRHYELPFSENEFANRPVLTADQANHLAATVLPDLLSKSKLKQKALESLEEKKKLVLSSAKHTISDQQTLGTM